MIGALLGLLGGAAVIALWLRPGPRRPQVVASLVLLRRILPPPAPRSRRRLPDPLSLALTLLALFAIAAALHRALTAPPLLIVADRSASMGAAGRAAAVDAALDPLVWDPDRALTLALLPAQAIVAQGQRGPLPALPAPAGADAVDIGLLDALCGGPALLLTDRPLPCPGDGLALAPQADLGLTHLALRPVDALGGVELQLTIEGEGRRDLRLDIDGAPFLDRPGVGAGRQHLVAALPPGQRLRLRLEGADALPADDIAQIDLAAARPIAVSLLTDQPDGFLARALAAHPRVALQVNPPETAPPPDLWVIDGGDRPLPAGPRVLAFGVGAGAGSTPTGALRQEEDPLLAYVSFEGLRIEAAKALPAAPGDRILLHGSGGPLALVRDGGAAVLFAFRPADSDLPLRPDFVHLLANLVEAAAPPLGPAAITGLLDAAELAQVQEPASAAPGEDPAPWALLPALALFALAAESLLVALRRPH